MLVSALDEQVEIFALSGLLVEKAARVAKEKYGAAVWLARLMT